MKSGRASFDSTSTYLASLSDVELAALMETGVVGGGGVGGGSVRLDLNGVAVFAKQIPLTDWELANCGSTAMILANWLVTAVCGVETPRVGGPVARNEYVHQCATGDVPDGTPPSRIPAPMIL
jgi:hypothetical protein